VWGEGIWRMERAKIIIFAFFLRFSCIIQKKAVPLHPILEGILSNFPLRGENNRTYEAHGTYGIHGAHETSY